MCLADSVLMVRGLDGYFDLLTGGQLCGFQAPAWAWSRHFSVVIARGPHLFPFRTEQLSPSAPMVLGSQGPGRVGRRRSFIEGPPPRRPFVVEAAYIHSGGRCPRSQSS